MINCILMTIPCFQNVWFATTWVCANYSTEGIVPFSEKPKLNSRNLSQPFYVFSFDTDSEIQLFCGFLWNVLEITKEGDGDYTNWAFLHLYCDPSVAVVPNRRVKRGNITPPTLEIRFRTSPTLSLYFLKLASSCVGFCQLIHRVVKLLTQIWLLFKRNNIIPPKVRVQNNPHTMDDALTDSMTSVWFAALLKPSGYHLLPFDAPLLSSIVQTPNHHCVRWSQISKMTLLWIYEIQLVVN